MAFLAQIADNHGADHALSLHDSTGNPTLPVSVNIVDYLRMQGVKVLWSNVRGSGAKIYDYKNARLKRHGVCTRMRSFDT